MDFKPKYRLFVLLMISVLLSVNIFLIDDKSSNISKANIRYNQYSTNELFDDISNTLFKTNLVKKNSVIDELGEKISNVNFGGIIRYIKQKSDAILGGTQEIIKNRKVQIFKDNYEKAHAENKALFGITPKHSVFKLDKDCNNLPQPVLSISDYICRGEWQSIQIIVVPFADSISNLEVDLKNLPFSKQNIQCFIGEYAYCKKNKFNAENSGWIADPLIPFEIDSLSKSIRFTAKNYKISIAKGETKAIWLNYFVPDSVQAVDYTINIAVKASCAESSAIEKTELKLKVLDYIFPKTMHLKNAFSISMNSIKNYYNVTEISKNKQKEYFRFLLNYRLNPISIYNPNGEPFPEIEDWQWCIDRGANYFNLGYINYIPTDSLQLLREFREKLTKNIALIKKNNLMKYTFIYGFDEIRENDFPKLKQMYKQLRMVDKDIPFACTVNPCKVLSGYVNIWIPEIEGFKENIKLPIKNDKQWEYVCFTSKDDFSNFYMEYSALDPRILFWHCSKNNLNGFLYYGINNWIIFDTPTELATEYKTLQISTKGTTRWPQIPWIGHSYRVNDGQRFITGDGQLVYPGKNMELYPSIRLVNIRDGIEDNECFYQLKKWQEHFEKYANTNKAETIKAFLNKAYTSMPATKKVKKNADELIELMKEARILLVECSKSK